MAISLNLALAQSANGVYDTDGDGLIEISNLAQLDAVRYDLDGDGSPDGASGEAPYAAAFSTSGGEAVCEAGCSGYELVNNLDFGTTDLSRNWLPIGDRRNAFATTFNGNGHTISNLRIDRPNSDDVGLFGFIDGAAIHRVGLESVEIAGKHNVGSLAGYNNAQGSIGGSYAKGSVTATGNHIGGLVGLNSENGTITASYAATHVSGSIAVGGLVGWNVNSSSITASYATGGVAAGGAQVGGLVGSNGSGSSITGSYATGDVSAGGRDVGGLVGINGGGSNITGSYATGDVSAGGRVVGDLVGANYGNSRSSYATGSASTGDRFVGGLLGYLYGGGTVSLSYWDTDTSGLDNSAGGEGKTTTELQSPTSNTGIYAAWNPIRWEFGSSSQYPALKADMNGDGSATAGEFGNQHRYYPSTQATPTPPPQATPTLTPGHTPTATAPPVSGTGERFSSLSSGADHVCLLRDDGSVHCTGDNSHGQASPPDSGQYTQVDNGDTFSCALKTDGAVVCWGSVAGTFYGTNPPTAGTQPVATPTPLPTTTAPPVSGDDSCVETLSANGTVTGQWATDCQSETQANDDSGGYPYARYYSFILARESEVTIILESADADTYLYLREGEARSGMALHENDDHEGSLSVSRIQATLAAGSYTIEATTYAAGKTGSFTLTMVTMGDAPLSVSVSHVGMDPAAVVKKHLYGRGPRPVLIQVTDGVSPVNYSDDEACRLIKGRFNIGTHCPEKSMVWELYGGFIGDAPILEAPVR